MTEGQLATMAHRMEREYGRPPAETVDQALAAIPLSELYSLAKSGEWL